MPMQENSSSDNVRLTYIKQAAKGAIPGTGNFTIMRKNDDSLSGDPDTKKSGESTGDGLPLGQVVTGLKVGGDINAELAPTISHQDFIAAALRSTWGGTITSGALALTINTSAKTITRAAGSFVTDGFKVGDLVQLSNFTNTVNNTTVTLTSVAALSLGYLGDPTMVNETGGATTTVVRPNYVQWGTTDTWWAIIKDFTDLTNKSITYFDQRVDSMMMDFKWGEIAKIKFTFAGCGYDAQPTTPVTQGRTIDPVGTESALNASSDVGIVVIDGAQVDYCIEGLSLTVKNNVQAANSIGYLAPQSQKPTGLDVEISVDGYLTDSNFQYLKQKQSQTAIALTYFIKQGSKGYGIQIPAYQYTCGDPGSSGQRNLNKLSLKGVAKKDATLGNAIRIYKLT